MNFIKKTIICIFLFIILNNIKAIEIPFILKCTRAVALGEAFTAIADDENAGSYNPAGIIYNNENKISLSGKIFSYNFDNENYINNSINMNCIFKKNFGVQINYGTFGDNISLSPEKNFIYEGIKIILSFAHIISDNLSAGLNGNVLVQTGKAGGASFDFGLLYKINNYLNAGVFINNIIYSGNFLIIDDYGNVRIITYPEFINAGISARPYDFLLFSFEVKNLFGESCFFVDTNTEEKISFNFKRSYHLGVEYKVLKNMALRTGISAKEDIYDFEYLDNFKMRYEIAFGISYKIDFLQFDFTVANDFRQVKEIKNPFQFYFSISGSY